jgi:hypothetical protein
MTQKPKILLLTAALVAMTVPAVRLVSSKNAATPGPTKHQSGSYPDRQANRQEASRSKAGKPVRRCLGRSHRAERKRPASKLLAPKSQWRFPVKTVSVIDKWPDLDLVAVYQWLGTLPEGAGRDAGIKSMIRRERDSAPDTLQPWIDLISDPQLREKTRRDLDKHLKTARGGRSVGRLERRRFIRIFLLPGDIFPTSGLRPNPEINTCRMPPN